MFLNQKFELRNSYKWIFLILYMGLFRKKDRVIDLSERYNQNRHVSKVKETMEEDRAKEAPVGVLGFLGSMASAAPAPESSVEALDEGTAEEKRKRLIRRLMDMTSRIEDMSNQIYHLQQRMEVIEKKLKLSKGE